MFLKYLAKIIDDESGAVTVDWVVLAAAAAVVGSTVISTIRPGVESGANVIGTALYLATTF